MRIHAEGIVEPGARFRIAGWPQAYAIAGDPPPLGPRAIRASVHFGGGAPALHLLEE
jgi:hypothetical protein